VAGLAGTGFDPFVGRKLFSLAHKAGLKNIEVQVECYHLIAGEIDLNILKQWELKLQIAVPQIARILGDEQAARVQVQRFLEYLRRPDTLTYSNVFTVSGVKPPVIGRLIGVSKMQHQLSKRIERERQGLYGVENTRPPHPRREGR
jgi:hypothetical protein